MERRFPNQNRWIVTAAVLVVLVAAMFGLFEDQTRDVAVWLQDLAEALS